MKRKLMLGISSGVSMMLLLYGMVASGCALVILYAAWLGHVPYWHAAAAALAGLASLTVSHMLP